VPDFSLGLDAEVKFSPLMVTPPIGVTLPLWRDKTAAQITGAQANSQAAPRTATHRTRTPPVKIHHHITRPLISATHSPRLRPALDMLALVVLGVPRRKPHHWAADDSLARPAPHTC
jgi:hypothetical protein